METVLTVRRVTPGLIESLRAELTPAPGRWRRAVWMGLATMTAVLLSWSIQVPDFSAPVAAFFGLLPANVCTWRNLLRRLLLTGAGTLVTIPLAGLLVQFPWFLLPVFFAGIALVAYFSPVTHRAMEMLALLYPFITGFFIGVLDPAGMPTAVGKICLGYAVGIVTATIFSRLLSPDDAVATLADSLAAGLARARSRLAEVTARYTADRFEPLPGEAPISSQFARDMQLLERVRQEGRDRQDVIEFLAVSIVVIDRALTLTDTMDALARHDVGRKYRRLLAGQLTVLVTELDAGLGAIERAARERNPLAATATAQAGAQWPDYRAAVAAVHAQQLALRQSGALGNVELAEEANTDAFVQALVSLADSLHISPAELHEGVASDAEPATISLPRFDPSAARYAAAVGLGTIISYLVAMVAGSTEIFNILFHPAFLAVSSYGATIRRAGTRFTGIVIGCLIAIMTTIAVMPNISELPALALLVLAVTVPSAYVAIGGPRFSYVGVQIVVAFAVVGLARQAFTDIDLALWRVWGTLLGTAALFLALGLVGPDYAGRQLVDRFADVVRALLALLPRGEVPLVLPRVEATRRQIFASLPEILRLADEARAETVIGGVDTAAAIVTGGRAVRIGYRLAAICAGRSAHPRSQLSEALQTALADVETGIRAWLETALSMLEARHTTARPGSRGHRDAYGAAAAVAARPRPDVSGALTTLLRAVDAARSTELAEWPSAAHGAFVAEIEHLRRVVELLPSFDENLRQMILRGDESLRWFRQEVPGPRAT
jgi:uncharacterized membrane protein YccC